MGSNNNPRPILVTLIGIIYVLGGLAGLALGVMGALGVAITVSPEGAVASSALLVPGLIALIIGYGFLKGWSIFWYIGVFFTIIMFLGNVLALVGGGLPFIFGVAVSAVILLYLFSKKVKTFFLE